MPEEDSKTQLPLLPRGRIKGPGCHSRWAIQIRSWCTACWLICARWVIVSMCSEDSELFLIWIKQSWSTLWSSQQSEGGQSNQSAADMDASYDEELYEELCEMGFKSEHVMQALQTAGDDKTAALDWLYPFLSRNVHSAFFLCFWSAGRTLWQGQVACTLMRKLCQRALPQQRFQDHKRFATESNIIQNHSQMFVWLWQCLEPWLNIILSQVVLQFISTSTNVSYEQAITRFTSMGFSRDDSGNALQRNNNNELQALHDLLKC